MTPIAGLTSCGSHFQFRLPTKKDVWTVLAFSSPAEWGSARAPPKDIRAAIPVVLESFPADRNPRFLDSHSIEGRQDCHKRAGLRKNINDFRKNFSTVTTESGVTSSWQAKISASAHCDNHFMTTTPLMGKVKCPWAHGMSSYAFNTV